MFRFESRHQHRMIAFGLALSFIGVLVTGCGTDEAPMAPTTIPAVMDADKDGIILSQGHLADIWICSEGYHWDVITGTVPASGGTFVGKVDSWAERRTVIGHVTTSGGLGTVQVTVRVPAATNNPHIVPVYEVELGPTLVSVDSITLTLPLLPWQEYDDPNNLVVYGLDFDPEGDPPYDAEVYDYIADQTVGLYVTVTVEPDENDGIVPKIPVEDPKDD